MDVYKLFIGDDTHGDFGRKFFFTPISDLDLTDCIGQFTVAGVTKTFTNLVSGEPQELVFTRAQTGSMKRGMYRATLAIYDSTGRHRTIANDILVKVTDVVEEVYSGVDNTIRFTVDSGVSWEGVSNKPPLVTKTELGDALANIDIPDTATQRDVRQYLQNLVAALKGLAVCIAAMFCLASFGMDSTTEWQDVTPTNLVKDVVELFSPPADFTTNNTQLVETIEATSPTADFTTNNTQLVQTIERTSPAPGDYANVSNKAVNALQNSGQQVLDGELTVGDIYSPFFSFIGGGYFGVSDLGRAFYNDSSRNIYFPATDVNNTTLATVDDIPTTFAWSDITGKPTNVSSFANDAGYLTPSATNALESSIVPTIPNNITRTATDATLVHCDSGNCTNSLVYIRQASSSLAGLMTAADKTKLDGVNDYANVSNKAVSAIQPEGSTSITIHGYDSSLSLEPPSGLLGGHSTYYNNGSIQYVSGQEFTYTFPEESGVLATLNDIPAIDISGISNTVTAVSNECAATRAIVTTWEGFLDGSNVVFSITNYLSGAYALDTAKFKVVELREGAYQEVYNSRDEIVLHLNHFKTNEFAAATNSVMSSVAAQLDEKADKAWGRYTSAGGEAPSNTVYMTAPNTVFAGGLEYERVAVGEGTVCVLTTRGAPTYTQGDEGTFKFQDSDGEHYFGFSKTDSYTIGANTDGITASSGIVTLTYNITMSGRPCVWYKADLTSSAPWEQLNMPDGSAAEGASHAVSWEQNPPANTQVCYINCGSEPQGFFRATVEVAGEAKFMTNMRADLAGGIQCTNTASGVVGVIRPTFNGSAVNWVWSAN